MPAATIDGRRKVNLFYCFLCSIPKRTAHRTPQRAFIVVTKRTAHIIYNVDFMIREKEKILFEIKPSSLQS